MANQNRNITVVDVFIHQNRVPSVRGSQIYQMIVILTVVVDNLVCMSEFMEQLIAHNVPSISDINSFIIFNSPISITIPIIADRSKHLLRVFSDNAYPAIPEAQAVL